MTTMVRKQVYLEARQDALLKALARRLGVTEAELIRRSLDRALAGLPVTAGGSRPGAWQEARAYCLEWATGRAHRPTRRWTRDELYEERLASHGRTRPD
jgi:hypothetical protein